MWWWLGFLAFAPYILLQLALRARDELRHRKLLGFGDETPAERLRKRYSAGPRMNVHTASLEEAHAARRGGKKVVLEGSYAPKGGCRWALVTGASSGVGFALCEQLATAGFSIVMVALDEPLLDTAVDDLRKRFGGKGKSDGDKGQEFRRVGANLGKHDGEYDYMKVIEQAVDDIDVQCLFLNAGYLVSASLGRMPAGSAEANFECNVTCPTRMARFFMERLLAAALPGCITFTSSAGAMSPLPVASLYAAGKAYLSTLGACLAMEGGAHGIDVCTIQSGPIATPFSKALPDVSFSRFTNSIADPPEVIADVLLSSVGVVTWRDSSVYTVVTRLLFVKLLDINFFAALIKFFLPFSKEFKQEKKFG
jgi:NAD(P)-dependent dehydrogenase (short-subunit alcohol dehydrogenase family)